MPIYEYQCLSCGKNHEVMQRYTDMPLTVCPECGGSMKKLISNTSFILKGTGWYKTDYASSRSGGVQDSAKGNGSKPGSVSKDTKTETKSEKKAEPAAKTE